MSAAVLCFAILAGAALQPVLPRLAWLGHAPVPLLAGLVVYYAFLRGQRWMLAAAMLAGLVEDLLGLMPVGCTSFGYVLAGSLCHYFRGMVMVRQWSTHALFGAVTAGLGVLANAILLALGGTIGVGPGWLLLRLLGAALGGAVATPLVFRALAGLDEMLGNLEPEKA
jgi:cell shape-determining protein MreD